MVALVIAEHDNGSLKGSTHHTVTAAAKCGGDVHVLVVGSNCGAAAEAAAQIAGVSKVLVADAPYFADGLAENVAAQVLAVAGTYSHILAPATAYGKNILPRVAAKLDVGADLGNHQGRIARHLHASDLRRQRDRHRAVGRQGQSHHRARHRLRRGACERRFGRRRNDRRRCRLRQVGFRRPRDGEIGPSGTDGAKIIVSGGRGMGSGENFKLLEPLADKLGAAMGASRAAVDAGYVPNDWQVGQTGKIVAPALYIAVGISGAIQHLAGMKDSKTIVAINKDPEAPIFSVADYGLVGDLFEVIPQLVKELG